MCSIGVPSQIISIDGIKNWTNTKLKMPTSNSIYNIRLNYILFIQNHLLIWKIINFRSKICAAYHIVKLKYC